MMSQNRQEEKDRRRAENDYKVNLKTEIMIEDLYDKVNAILAKQSALEKKLLEQEESSQSPEIVQKEPAYRPIGRYAGFLLFLSQKHFWSRVLRQVSLALRSGSRPRYLATARRARISGGCPQSSRRCC